MSRSLNLNSKVYKNTKTMNFESENLVVDWISFNLQGLTSKTGVEKIACHLSSYFTPLIIIDDMFRIGYSGLRNKYHVSLRQYTKNNWVGTQIIFSGENAVYLYKLLKTQKFDWSIFKFDGCSLSLGRIDLCFSRTNNSSNTTELFDAFLLNSRSKIQNHTNTRYIKLEDFPSGKMLKVNRRNNSLHYRVYQNHQDVRFELEFKHRQTKLVQDYLFHNQLDIFEQQLIIQYFKYSRRLLCLDFAYTDWILDFQRRQQDFRIYQSLVTSYIENQIIRNQEEEERLFHLLQFLSFLRGLELNPFKDCKKHRIKEQFYYSLEFPLSEFVKFTNTRISNHSEREKLIMYFEKLQKLDPIIKRFSNKAFRSYVCFPYVECTNPSGKSWVIEVLIAEELFCFPYPFQLPTSFLSSVSKNDLRLKVRLIKSLAVSNQEKTLNLEEFFNRTNIRNDQLIRIKKNIIQLFKKLVENKIIQNEIKIILKSGKNKDLLIKNITTSDITRRIKYVRFQEIFRKSI